MNNLDKQTKEICALLRNGISAEEIANNLSAALQAAEKQLAEEENAKKAAKENIEKSKSDLCNCLRNYINCAHKETCADLHLTDDELIYYVDSAIKGTATAYKLFFDDKVAKSSNWEKLFSDFFDKYNL